jgi:hypothetical protein
MGIVGGIKGNIQSTTLLGIIITGIKWRALGNFALFFLIHIFPVDNKPADSAFWVHKGYGSSYFNCCLTFTREDFWNTRCSFLIFDLIWLILHKILRSAQVFPNILMVRIGLDLGGLEIKLRAAVKAVAP